MSQQQTDEYVKMDEESHDVKEVTQYEYIYTKFVRPGLAEFFGLMLFVFINVMAVYSTKNILSVAVAHGFALFVLITMFAPISGGHLNPAVSLGAFIAGKMTWPYLILYPIAQLLGALVGALLALCMKMGQKASEAKTMSAMDVYVAGHFPDEGITVWQAMAGEIIITFMLVLVVLMTTDRKYKTGFAPLAIGITVLVNVLSCGHIIGGSMNPARSFGTAIASALIGKMKPLHYLYVYFIGPLAGGALGAVAYKRFSRQPRLQLRTPAELFARDAAGDRRRQLDRRQLDRRQLDRRQLDRRQLGRRPEAEGSECRKRGGSGGEHSTLQRWHFVSDIQREKRLERCRLLLQDIHRRNVGEIVFSNERLFTTPAGHRVMAWAAVSRGWKGPLLFVPPEVKISAQAYVEHALVPMATEATRHFGDRVWTFQQDDAGSHTANATQEWCSRHLPNFWPRDMWPPASPDLNVMDACVWSLLEAETAARSPGDAEELRAALADAWRRLPQRSLRAACDSFPQRLRAVINAAGDYAV